MAECFNIKEKTIFVLFDPSSFKLQVDDEDCVRARAEAPCSSRMSSFFYII